MSDHHCYACDFDMVFEKPTNKRYARIRAQEYEDALEAIEAWEGTFSIAILWKWYRDNRMWGPRQFNILRIVVKDLATHDLIRCVRRTPTGKCREWAKR